MSRLDEGLLERVQGLIVQYGLLPDSKVSVACSGGKDSVLACKALRELGFRVTPVVVDMGYEAGWADRVTRNLTALDFIPVVLRSQSVSGPVLINIGRRDDLRHNLQALQSLEEDSQFTPCTSCYNTKVILLAEYLNRSDIDRIVFAHHATDAIASLLKSALMYIDRWYRGSPTYESRRFRDLAREAKSWFESVEGSWLSQLRTLVSEGKASTDEPPIQSIMEGTETLIVRPLLGIWEHEVEAECPELGELEASGCGHTLADATQTPREIVQFETVRPLEVSEIVQQVFMSLLLASLDESGRLLTNVRRQRNALLGPEYKPALQGINKL